MMARENSEAYKQNADVLLESIRATIDALHKGQIKIGNESGQMEAPNGNTSKNKIRYAPSFIQGNAPSAAAAEHTYSAETLGKFLGINATLMHHLLFREMHLPERLRNIPIPLRLWGNSLVKNRSAGGVPAVAKRAPYLAKSPPGAHPTHTKRSSSRC